MQPATAHHVGPNAILQTVEALQALAAPGVLGRICTAAGMPGLAGNLPDRMVPARDALRLHRAVAEILPPDMAEAVARDAGRRTGEYILTHRIPAPAQGLLRLLPRPLAGPMLLGAISRHAWTFAGDAQVSWAWGRTPEFVIHDNPMALPGCPWHCAVFETLFQRLVAVGIMVEHTACCAAHGPVCRFVLHTARRPQGRTWAA